jgi:hypothetical protein
MEPCFQFSVLGWWPERELNPLFVVESDVSWPLDDRALGETDKECAGKAAHRRRRREQRRRPCGRFRLRTCRNREPNSIGPSRHFRVNGGIRTRDR